MTDQLDLFDDGHGRPHYPEVAGAKERGGTSEDAATEIEDSGRAATLRSDVLLLLSKGNYTADECAALLEKDILSIRPRLTELFKQDRIEKTGERRPSSRGKSSVVWRKV